MLFAKTERSPAPSFALVRGLRFNDEILFTVLTVFCFRIHMVFVPIRFCESRILDFLFIFQMKVGTILAGSDFGIHEFPILFLFYRKANIFAFVSVYGKPHRRARLLRFGALQQMPGYHLARRDMENRRKLFGV